MTDERSTGIILRTRPLTESSLIVHWLTRDLGRLSTVAKGARRSKSPFRGKLDLFYLADFSFGRSRRSDLHLLREVSVREFHAPLRRDLASLDQASQFTKLVERTTETETPIPELFDLVDAALRHLSTHPGDPLTLCAFKVKLLHHLGLQPNISDTALSPATKHAFEHLATLPFSTLSSSIPPQTLQTLENYIDNFMRHHL